MKKGILIVSALMLLMACGGKKTSGDDYGMWRQENKW